jgi:vitamin B12 transporter
MLIFIPGASGEETEKLEPVVVTASRVPTPQAEVAQSISVIEPTESDRQSGRPLFEILRSAPGISVMNSGGPGRLTEVYIRGSGYQQTLIMVDGVVMNDPSSPGRGYDFGRLTARQVDRIEVLSGSQSGVHGANAIGGVINIITRRQRGNSALVFGEYGAFDTRRGSVIGSAETGSTTANINLAYDETDGFPAASRLYGNSINSGNQAYSGSLSTDTKLEDDWHLQTTARAYRARTELPFSGGASGDDPNHLQLESQGTARAELSYRGGRSWEPSVAISYFKTFRKTDNAPDPVHTDAATGRYHGARLRVEQLNRLELNESNSLVLGIDSQMDRASIYDLYAGYLSQMPSVSQSVSGIFAENRWKSGGSFASVAVRGDRFHGFSDQLTYRLGPGHRFESTGTTLKGSIGRGFKIPSLDQLYAPLYGNRALAPETSLSYDITLQQDLGKDLVVQTTWFQSQFSNLIQGDLNDFFKYKNIGSATSKGLETSMSYSSPQGTTLSINHTFLLARNNDKNQDLVRRPRQSLNASIRGRMAGNIDLGLNGRYIGERNDFDPVTYSTIRMPGYALFHADASYQMGGGYKAFGRLDNIFDREYEEVAGFGTARRSLYIGLQKEI